MRELKIAALIFCVAIFPRAAAEGGVYLGFDNAIPGTLADVNGLGTGFTHRLPGTGSEIPTNDPAMNLSSLPGYLQLDSSNGNIGGFGGGTDLAHADSPGVFLVDVNGDDLVITASFVDVDVAAHQLAIYVGTQSDRSIRAGFHGPNQFYLAANEGGAGDFGWSSGANAFSAGDDIILSLSRTQGSWSVSWSNLSDPARSGSSTDLGFGTGLTPFPELNAESSLYTGLIHSASSHHSATVDYFSVEVVPEASSLLTWLLGVVTVSVLCKKRVRAATCN